MSEESGAFRMDVSASSAKLYPDSLELPELASSYVEFKARHLNGSAFCTSQKH